MLSITELSEKSLPEAIQNVITNSPTVELELIEWISEFCARQVVAQAGESHELVLLKQRVDWKAIAQACQGYRLYAGKQGVEAQHTLQQLCLGIIVKQYYDWSYETTARQVQRDGLLRWFVGYRLNERSFSSVTLWRFDDWLKEHHPRLLFTKTLQMIDEDFPEERTAPQVGDTYAMLARAAPQSHTVLLRMTAKQVLSALEQVSADASEVVHSCFALETLFGASDETPERFMQKPERDALEVQTALAAHHLLRLVQGAYAALPRSRDCCHLALERRLTQLHKVLNDEFTFVLDEQSVCVQASQRSKHEKGVYAIGSAVDPEATFRQHRNRNDFCYNIGIDATKRFIRETSATTGATPDSKLVAPGIEAQKQHLGLTPPKLIYDRAAGTAKIYAEVEQASGGQTQLVARLVDHSQTDGRFGPQDCTLSEEGRLSCPAGQSTTRAYRSGSGNGWNYRFSGEQCKECPLWQKCRKADASPNGVRSFFISDYVYQQRKSLLYLSTESFKQDMKLRPGVERVISCLVRYHGARHADGYGLLNADYQARNAAMAFNLSQWVRLTNERRNPKRSRRKDEAP